MKNKGDVPGKEKWRYTKGEREKNSMVNKKKISKEQHILEITETIAEEAVAKGDVG